MADLAHGRLAERLEDLLGLLLERGEALLERGRRVDEVVDALAGVGADGVQQRLEVEDVVADRLQDGGPVAGTEDLLGQRAGVVAAAGGDEVVDLRQGVAQSLVERDAFLGEVFFCHLHAGEHRLEIQTGLGQLGDERTGLADVHAGLCEHRAALAGAVDNLVEVGAGVARRVEQ